MAASGGSLERLIVVVGTHRSGTTLLGRALERHPDVAYWEEPRHVWSWGHNYRHDDVLTAADATPRVRAQVRRRFSEYLEASGRARLAEKTPSNCLRLPFILDIFPEALFLHIYRDGRAVLHSTDVVNRTDQPHADLWLRRLSGTPLWEWPAFVPRAWRTLGHRMLGRPMAFWGPQPPGWREWVRKDTRLAVLAKQWRYSVEPILDFRSSMPSSQWLDLRYEDLVTDPATQAKRIERFARLPEREDFERHLERVCRSDRAEAWRSRLSAGELDALRPILAPTLDRLGYDW